MIARTGRFSLIWLIAILVLTGLLWMDICLYLKIQSFECKDKMQTKYDDDLYEQQTFNYTSSLAFGGRLHLLAQRFSFAFHGISVKLIMSDPVDNYLMGPLAELFASLCDFKQRLLFVSANMVSYSGVVSAVIAGWLVSFERPGFHKLSFVFFQIRTWLDDLDGIVARARRGIYKHVSLTNTSGYLVDGVCDALGFAAYIIGCYIFLRNSAQRLRAHQAHENTINRLNLRSITCVRSATPQGGSASHSPLIQYEDAPTSTGETYESDSDCETFLETNDEEVEILCNDSSREVTPLFDKNAQRFRGIRKSNKSNSPAQVFVNRPSDGEPSNPLFYRYIEQKIKDKLSDRRLVLLVLAYSLQLALCSFFWNRYILIYRDLLESPSSNKLQARAKMKVLKSNIMCFLFWFWRLTNGHSFMQMFAASIFMNRVLHFLEIIKYIGFVEILLLAMMTELHVRDLQNYLSDLV